MNRKHPFETGYRYHVYNRGVDKRLIFKLKGDYKRFLFTLEKCNSGEPARHLTRDHLNVLKKNTRKKKSDPVQLVEIHAFCLMPNHYHIILEQLVDGGISKFLQKVMTSFTQYFNVKYERSGVLFQGRTKSKLIDDDDYLCWLTRYIAMNPLDLCEPKWKEKGISDRAKSLRFLRSYKWKSEFDYADFNSHVQEFTKKDLRYDIFP